MPGHHYHENYKGYQGKFASGHSSYDDPKSKEPPVWKTLILVILAIAGGTGLLVGGFVLPSYFMN